jgi:hypothetical protein
VFQLAQPATIMDAGMVNILRVFAECVLFNLASLTPFCETIDPTLDDWGDALDRLFPGDGASTSPFLGGLQGLYRVQLRIHMLLRSVKQTSNGPSVDRSRLEVIRECSDQLDTFEQQLLSLSPYRSGDYAAVRLYKAKHRIFILTARIHLHKVAHPEATALDYRIQSYVNRAIAILRIQDIKEPGNPAMRWPLTVLACATSSDEDFRLVTDKMRETEEILDPANSRKLAAAYTVLHRHRAGCASILPGCQEYKGFIQPIDILLMPQLLDEPQA